MESSNNGDSPIRRQSAGVASGETQILKRNFSVKQGFISRPPSNGNKAPNPIQKKETETAEQVEKKRQDDEGFKKIEALFEKAAQRGIFGDDDPEAEAPKKVSAPKLPKTAKEIEDQETSERILKSVLEYLNLSSNADHIYKETQGHPVVFHVEENKDPLAVGNISHSKCLPATKDYREGVDLAKPNSIEPLYVHPVKTPVRVPASRVTYTATIADTGTPDETEILTKIADQRDKVFPVSTP